MPSEFDVFLSYHWRDQEDVRTLADQLHERGLTVFLDRWYLTPGQPWPQDLERVLAVCNAVAVCVGPGEMGTWQQREKVFALERQGREPGFPVIPILLPGADSPLGFLGQNTWVDFRVGLDQPAMLATLVAAIRRMPPGPNLRERLQKTLASVCPYKGLAYFREEDSDFFCGRDRAIETLYDAVEHRSFVAVVGASGSGKSSVVRAGLVPKLRRDTQTPWEIVILVPGDRPFYRLASGLMPLLEPDRTENDGLVEIGKQARALQAGTVKVRDVVERFLQKQSGTKRFLLIVDQWEELYTLAPETDARSFTEGLLEAATAGVSSIVLTLRGDFMGRAIGYRQLADQLQDGQVILGPMIREELRQAIEEPAHKVGANFEAGLVERILDDVGDAPGRLPLVEFVLQQLWNDPHRKHQAMRHAAYDAMGGVEEALTRHADAVLAQLPHQVELLRRIFVQLVRPGEGTEDTRQLATRTQVGETNWPLVTRLADARLVITGRDAMSGEETVEVVHEALIQHWQPLRQWLREDRAFRVWQNRLRQSIQEWEEKQRDEGTLLQGARLAEADERLAQHAGVVSVPEREFIEASRAYRDREVKARQRRVRNMFLGLAAGLIIALGLALWANNQRQHAEAATAGEKSALRLAQSRQLAAQAELALNRPPTDIVLGSLLATEALKREQTLEAYRAWAQTAQLPREVHRFGLHKDQRVEKFAFSPDSKRVAAIVAEGSTEAEGQVHVWNTATIAELAQVKHADHVAAVAFSPDGTLLATGSWDHTVVVSDAATGAGRHRFTLDAPVWAVTFSPNGHLLAAGGRDGKINVYALSAGSLVRSFQHTGEVTQLAFGPNSERLLSGGSDGANLWDLTTGLQSPVLAQGQRITHLTISSDGHFVASVRKGETAVSLWSSQTERKTILLKHDAEVTHIAFAKASQRLVTASTDKIVRVWDRTTGKEIARFQHTAFVWGVWPSPDGKYFVTKPNVETEAYELRGQLNRPLLWAADEPGRPLGELPHPEGVAVERLAFSADGRHIATVADDRRVRLWETDSKRLRGELPARYNVVQLAFSPDGQKLAIASRPARAGEGYTWGEARVWDTDSGKELVRFGGATRLLHGIAYSPDGKRIATAGNDGVVILWDGNLGTEQSRFSHAGAVRAVNFTPDGSRLMTYTQEGGASRAYLWDIAIGQPRAAMALGDPGAVKRLQFSGDHSLAATSGVDNTIRIWDTATGRELRRFDVPRDPDTGSASFDLASDGKRLAWRDADGRTLQVRSVTTGVLAARLEHDEPVGRLELSGNGNRVLAYGSQTQTYWVWDVDGGRILARLSPPEDGANVKAQLSPDGSTVATMQFPSGQVVLWDASTGRRIAELRHEDLHASPSMLQAFTNDGRFLLTSSKRGLHVWDGHTGARVRLLLDDSTDDFQLSPDRQRIVLANLDQKSIELRDLETGKRVTRFAGPAERLKGLAFNRKGDRFAAGIGLTPEAMVWNVTTGKKMAQVKLNGFLVSVGFLADGRTLLTHDAAGHVKAWDTITGKERFRLAHAAGVNQAVMNAESGRIATANGSLAQVWDIASGRKLAEFAHQGEVRMLVFSGRGHRLATLDSDFDKRVGHERDQGQIWDVETSKQVARFAHGDSIKALVFSKDGTRIATGSEDRTARLWDAANSQELARLDHDGAVQGAAYSDDGQLLAAYAPVGSGSEQGIEVWHLPTRRKLARLPHYGGDVMQLRFSPDNRWLATAGRAGSPLRLWAIQSARQERLSIPHADWPRSMSLSPDGLRLATVTYGRRGEDKGVQIWDLRTGKSLVTILHHSEVYQVSFSPDGKSVVTAGADRTARIWDAANGEELHRLEHDDSVTQAIFSPRGLRIATKTNGGAVRIWDPAAGRQVRVAKDSTVTALAFSADGGRLVTSEGKWEDARDKYGNTRLKYIGLLVARIWDTATGKELLRLPHEKPVANAIFSPDGSIVATDMALKVTDVLQLWATRTGERIAGLQASPEGEGIKGYAFSPDGKYLSAHTHKEVFVWEVMNQRQIVRFGVDDGLLLHLVFSSDGRYLAASNRHEVLVWDRILGRELARLSHPGDVTDIAFTPDDARILSATQSDMVHVWAWKQEELISDACSRLERNLTQEEWRTYLGDEPYRPTCPALPASGK